MVNTSLIIVDMQPEFQAAIDPTLINACKKLIVKAKEETNPIFFVEYRGSGRTIKELTSLVKSYSFKDFIFKNEMSGAEKIHQYFVKCKIKPVNLDICGVYTDQCVYGTALGLRELGYNVSLKLDACRTTEEFFEDAKININKLVNKGVQVI